MQTIKTISKLPTHSALSRRELLKSVAGIGALGALIKPASCLATVVRPEQPIEVGLTKQLLVDDYVIAETQNLTRSLGRVVKANDGKRLEFMKSAENGS